jgi:hypothetical protein
MKSRQGNVEMLDLQLSAVTLLLKKAAMSLMVSLTVSLSMMLEKMREFEQLMGLIPLF